MKDLPIFPAAVKKHLPVWPVGREGGKLDEQGMYYAEQISQKLGAPPDDWLVLIRDYSTQSVDTAALEADNSNGWYDVQKQTLHLVIASQFPQEVIESLPQMLAKSVLSVTQVILHPCYTWGIVLRSIIISLIIVRSPLGLVAITVP